VTLTIASYNIQVPAAKAEFHGWEGRKEELLATLPTLGDLFGLQEVSYVDVQGPEVSNQLRNNGFDGYEPSHNDFSEYDDEFHQRNPIFWKADKFELKQSHVRLLTTGTTEEQQELPNIENRYSTHVLLEHVSGDLIHFFNLHQQHVPIELTDEELIARYAAVQVKGLIALHEFAQEVNPENNPAIIVGDFNSVSPTVMGFTCAKKTANENVNGQYNSYHGYVEETAANGDYIIDHILSNFPAGDILRTETLIEDKGSDHYPLQASFKHC